MEPRNLTLLTDLYELTMMQGYFKEKDANETVIFDMFYRTNPHGNGFAICAGLEQAIEYIKGLHFDESDIEYLRSLNIFAEDFLEYLSTFRFTGDIYAIPEGTVVFPRESLIKVIAPIMQAQLVETALLTIINHQSLIATKTERIVHAAKGDGVMEFGLRRAQGADAGTYGARAAMIAGCIGTSNVLCGKMFDVPVKGTHAHSWIMSFPDELTAFRTYAKLYPSACILLVDTYDTLKSGIPNAIKVFKEMREAGIPLTFYGIRLDSGDLAYLSKKAKKMLDAAAKALDVEVQYVDQGHVSEQVTASVEQLCAAGCNGIVICNSADSEMTSAIQTCDANQVYLTQFYRIISEENSPEVYQTACNSQYYLGAVHEDEVTNGYTLVNLLLENGDRNIGLEAWTVGDATFQQRWTGYKQAVDEWNEANPDDQATITEPVYANTSSEEGAAAALSLYNSNPDMDALIVAGGGGDPLVGSIGALANEGLTGKIDVVSTDFLDDLGEQLESGGMFAESGGHFCDPLYAFLITYNAIKGNYVKDEGSFGYEIQFPYLYVSSSEDYENYKKYFVDDDPYTDEELVELAGYSFDDLNKAATSLSIDDVISRHSN